MEHVIFWGRSSCQVPSSREFIELSVIHEEFFVIKKHKSPCLLEAVATEDSSFDPAQHHRTRETRTHLVPSKAPNAYDGVGQESSHPLGSTS